MRDPARIERIIGLLRRAWKESPDQRLGQLLVNVAEGESVWHVEDDVTERGLREWLGLPDEPVPPVHLPRTTLDRWEP